MKAIKSFVLPARGGRVERALLAVGSVGAGVAGGVASILYVRTLVVSLGVSIALPVVFGLAAFVLNMLLQRIALAASDSAVVTFVVALTNVALVVGWFFVMNLPIFPDEVAMFALVAWGVLAVGLGGKLLAAVFGGLFGVMFSKRKEHAP